MHAKLSDRASSCSTSVSFSPNFEDCFYIGSQEKADNLVVVQLTEESLTFEHKRCKKSVTLSLTTIEESMYLRDERSKLTSLFSGLRNKIKEFSLDCDSFDLLEEQVHPSLPSLGQLLPSDRIWEALPCGEANWCWNFWSSLWWF